MGIRDRLRLQAQRWPWLYGRLRSAWHAWRRLAGAATVRALPPDAMRAAVELAAPLPAFSVNAAAVVTVRVTNLAPRAWPAGALALSYHWHRAGGGVWAFDGGRTPLAVAVPPGASLQLACAVRPPNTPAEYGLELDLVDAAGSWFSKHGSPGLRLEVTVGGMQPDTLAEIDYEQIYAGANLARDFWSVSGPASAEEFRQLGRAKVEMLKTLGLQPDSRVLDVGCGTGSVAEALLDFLRGEGLYYGTDLSEVAVGFCRQHYGRTNFLFAKNAMTALPIAGRSFDFVVFFSVFTHTYPAETRALLAEAVRLLAPAGQVVADVFESEIEAESLGTRAMIVLPRGRMLELAGELGLEARTLSEFAWDPAGPRRIDRVMRRFARRPGLVNA